MKFGIFALITSVMLFRINFISGASSGSEGRNELNYDDFSWFTEEHSLVTPEEMRLPSMMHHVPAPTQEETAPFHREHRKIDDADRKDRSHEVMKEQLKRARATGIGSLFKKKKPRTYSTSDRAIQLRQERQRIFEDPATAVAYLDGRKAKEKIRRAAWTPEKRAAHNARARKISEARREWLRLPGNEVEREAFLARARFNRARYNKKKTKKNDDKQ